MSPNAMLPPILQHLVLATCIGIAFWPTCEAARKRTVRKAQRPDLVYRIPTDNQALFKGDNEGFFMYVDRTFENESTRPWEAGTYGFVRNPFRPSNGELMFSRLHEGIDIKPIRRDADEEPLDIVRPVAPGKVVHVNNTPGHSNYGRYIVVAHFVPEGTIYTLYAHLAETFCQVGQRVGTGNKLGRLGYTGVGINKRRAHLHLEIGFMINSQYEKFAVGDNKHGNYNGLNLIGFDITKLFIQCRNGKPASIRRYLSTIPEHYRVRVPCVGTMDIMRRHPFLYKGDWKTRPAALDIAFSAEGVPLAIYPADTAVDTPRIISCTPKPTLQQNCTVNRVKNSSKNAALTASGLRYINQYLWLEGQYPEPESASSSSSTSHP